MDYDVVIAGSGGGGLTPGVTIWTKTAVEHLTFDGGRGTGLVADRAGGEVELHAGRGVLLATGGCGGNDALRAEMMPTAARGLSLRSRKMSARA
jgi:aspartate oxidase